MTPEERIEYYTAIERLAGRFGADGTQIAQFLSGGRRCGDCWRLYICGAGRCEIGSVSMYACPDIDSIEHTDPTEGLRSLKFKLKERVDLGIFNNEKWTQRKIELKRLRRQSQAKSAQGDNRRKHPAYRIMKRHNRKIRRMDRNYGTRQTQQ